ncbi:MAG: hypothetical protein A3G34_16590 [Candidatus Lindowbacteria bacterium RIFCSPLOWO2_12_FULL_62_27]|nr:MAG: hypothetical protein A3I06_00165 [Candidatus Lindowbacteria bacterium RIFCSPLOWO2_02_FULL_62_12]OGH62849.1 MAG: hypothetical protein A3G34_16590 [Candidatus Lindowbacteria bacterium RIFCSPLOWO2_12_FULL_62_27]
MLILFLFQTTVSTADESVREEIRALQARLAELERQAGKPRASGGNEFNPRITAFGDFTGRIDNGPVRNENNEEISDRFNMREVELDLRADVDPYAKGVLITALSQERPLQPASVAIEEGYVLFTALSRGVSAKAGKFKNAFGILNQLHLHDLPQSTLPLPIQTFLGEDGMAEMGLSVHYIMPQKNPDHVLSLTGEVFNGENATQFGGVSSRDPAYLGRAKYYMELDPESFMELGTSYMNGKRVTDNVHHRNEVLGGDFMYKWRAHQPKGLWSTVVQGEFFYMSREEPALAIYRRNASGAYGLLQIQPYQRWFAGVRYDRAQVLNNKTLVDRKIGGYVSFYTTEFLRLRLGYEYQNSAGPEIGGTPGPDQSTIYGQITFVFGAHPAEPYWFSK